jgi:NCS1 family nucleobase:cation symporter-1
VASGLSVWQAMISIILGKAITAAVAVFNGSVGAEWHIGFPVVSRYIWGVRGQFILLIQRIILSLVVRRLSLLHITTKADQRT